MYVFGPKIGTWLITPFQMAANVGTGIVYIITGAQSAQHVYRVTIGEEHDLSLTYFILLFAGIQLLLVQLRDFHSLRWVSFGGAIMAAGYCTIAGVSSIVHIFESDEQVYYDQRERTALDIFFGDCNSIGSIFFSFGGMATFLEIQAALPSPSQKPMLKGFVVSCLLSVFLYFFVAVTGYLAFGNAVSQNVLLSVRRPVWVSAAASGMVFLHVVAAYQVFSMPVFEWFQSVVAKKIEIGRLFRFVYRAIFVLLGAVVAGGLPFFAAMNGFVGAVGIGMTTFIVPFLMMYVFFNDDMRPYTKFAIIAIVIAMALLSLLGCAGAVYNIVEQMQN
eukprot:TRINITY_DN1693_c0_g1_i2.p1 TRINITY_DN1693_c0_g1~~TRINITY_DN1693_c0_g1_i2.p1  ORF type:complete len:332 (-),score=40.72 TRINITY_DN1693_c0_g1_i2:86-1081(-)